MRLQKLLAQYGLGSRRQIEQMISEQKILVNGVVAELGCKADVTDKIKIDGKLIRLNALQKHKTRVLLYNKPLGEICSRSDPDKRPTVFTKLPKLKGERWIVIGRLDINTSGLLLFTNNGELAHKLMHPSSNIVRKYAVRVFGDVVPDIINKLIKGVMLEDGKAKFDTITDAGGKGINHWYNVTIKEGRKREVRRLWESQGLQVSRIIRIQFGDIILPKSLKQGNFLELNEQEIRKLL